jgi:hypothetical protein
MKRSFWLLCAFVWLSVGFSRTLAAADPFSVEIPGLGWRISFDAPPLGQIRDERLGPDYTWRANSGRFNISLFVEEPANPGRTNKDSYAFYWPKGRRNPLIDQSTVEVTQTSRYVRVQYVIRAPYRGSSVPMMNVNYYFAHRGRWVDVHISVIGITENDVDIIRRFDESLSYGP